MAILSDSSANRLGFAILGLSNNFSYVIMLSAAFDLLHQPPPIIESTLDSLPSNDTLSIDATAQVDTATFTYCNNQSTSTILLADTLPSLITKIVYSFLLVGIIPGYKATAAALLAAISFVLTGLSASQLLIFTGVICASLSSGLGETTFLSNSGNYGESSLSGWAIGTGAAGLLASMSYASLRMIYEVKTIMIIMLIAPIAMIVAYFCIIRPVDRNTNLKRPIRVIQADKLPATMGAILGGSHEIIEESKPINQISRQEKQADPLPSYEDGFSVNNEKFGLKEKLRYLPKLSIYFLPLFLVFYSEYFINQGLFELIYYPEITFLDKAAQYRWFQVSYQIGVMISRCTLDFFKIKNIWAMSLLQAANAILFFAHASKWIFIPNFYLVIVLIVYEGLLGGFTYVNAFYRIRKEVQSNRLEFSTSTVLVGDSLGIVMAGLSALPVHKSLCMLYE